MSSSVASLETSILRQIPTSPEVIETLKNLQKITQINVESPDFKSELKQFSEEHIILYKSHTTQEGVAQYVCFLEDQREGDLYLNQLTGQAIKVQPLEGLILERKQHQKAKLAQAHLEQLKRVYEKLSAYMEQHFAVSYGVACKLFFDTGHFKIDANEISEIVIGITNKNSSSSNFSSAEWTSYWKFKPTEYSAKITSRNHFHEGGNIIFQRPKTIHRVLPAQKQFPLTNLSQQTIVRIVQAIQSGQKGYQKELQVIYNEKLGQALKKLRRISPVTQGKMIWNVNAVLLSEGLSERLPSSV